MTKPRTTTPRRRKGEGSVSRFHNHPTCPPVVDGVRADHDCKGPHRAMVWVVDNQGTRKRVALYGKTEGEVLAKIKATTVAEAKGEVVRSTVTVRDWMRTDALEEGIANWWALAAPTLKVNTRKGYVSIINREILPALGHHKLTALQPEHVRRMYADMAKRGLSGTTQRGVHRVLRRALLIAMREGKVARNVCDLLDPPKVQASTKPKALPVEDAWAVLRAAGNNPRHWVSLLTGLRQGEALALRWHDVVLDAPVPYLVVRESLSREPGVGLVFDKPKSATSTDREVPLVGQVADRLRAARDKHLGKGGNMADLVFGNSRTGGPMDPRRDYNGWCVLLDLAGVGHVSLHDARRTTAHLLEDAGVPDRVVAEILGHAQVTMTHRYQQGNMPAKVAGMQALEALLASKDTAA